MERSCLSCSNFALCDTIEKLKDEKGLVPIQMLYAYGRECSKYFNPRV